MSRLRRHHRRGPRAAKTGSPTARRRRPPTRPARSEPATSRTMWTKRRGVLPADPPPAPPSSGPEDDRGCGLRGRTPGRPLRRLPLRLHAPERQSRPAAPGPDTPRPTTRGVQVGERRPSRRRAGGRRTDHPGHRPLADRRAGDQRSRSDERARAHARDRPSRCPWECGHRWPGGRPSAARSHRSGPCKAGDRIKVVDGAGTFTYLVTATRVVTAGEHDVVVQTPKNLLTLITSSGGVAPNGRLAVQAQLKGQPVAVQAGVVAIPHGELGLGGDGSAIVPAVLWSLATILVLMGAALAVWLWRRAASGLPVRGPGGGGLWTVGLRERGPDSPGHVLIARHDQQKDHSAWVVPSGVTNSSSGQHPSVTLRLLRLRTMHLKDRFSSHWECPAFSIPYRGEQHMFKLFTRRRAVAVATVALGISGMSLAFAGTAGAADPNPERQPHRGQRVQHRLRPDGAGGQPVQLRPRL